MSFSDIEELDFIVEKVDSFTNESLKAVSYTHLTLPTTTIV